MKDHSIEKKIIRRALTRTKTPAQHLFKLPGRVCQQKFKFKMVKLPSKAIKLLQIAYLQFSDIYYAVKKLKR